MRWIQRSVCWLAITLGGYASADIIYVDADATPTGTGTSWADALPDLHSALHMAQAGDQVWIAAGTYRAVDALAIPGPFRVPTEVQVRGGFAGTETDPAQRPEPLPETILTADLNGDDAPGFVNRVENAQEVVRVVDGGAGTVLDGLVIEGAEKRVGSNPGAGVRADAGHLIMQRCTVRLNRNRLQEGRGAGIGVQNGMLTLIDCQIHDNLMADFLVEEATGGAGVFVGNATLLAIGCTFRDNRVETTDFAEGEATGAGMLIEATGDFAGEATLQDCRFFGNVATTEGGGLSVEVIDAAGLQLVLENCVFEENDADEGGGMFFRRRSPEGTPANTTVRLVGTNFIRNTARWVAGFAMAGGPSSSEVALTEVLGCRFEANHTIYEETYNFGSSGAMLRANQILVRDTRFVENVAETELRPPSAGVVLLPTDRVIVDNTVFAGNRIISNGGINRLRGSGAAFHAENIVGGAFANVLMRNVTIVGNRSAEAPAGLLQNINRAFLTNVTIAGNQALQGGGGLLCEAPLRMRNSIVWGNRTDSITEPVIGLQLNGAREDFEIWDSMLERVGDNLLLVERTLEGNPKLADLLGPDGIFATGDESAALGPDSPCIDSGNNNWLPIDVADLDGDGDIDEFVPFDAIGNPRLLDQQWQSDTGLGDAPIVDIGAQEYPLACPGDFNGDASIDISDLAELLRDFGLPAANSGASTDLQPNGVVDLSDLALLLTLIGQDCL